MAQYARQFFFLVCMEYDECTIPLKVFLDEYQAISYGRKRATKAEKEGFIATEFSLYKQEITHAGTMSKIKTLDPYKS